jgi:predicted dehydrogenase
MGSYLPDWHPWEDYRDMYSSKEGVGGILLDAIHGINYGRWFFGAEELVTGLLSYDSSLEIETEDTVNLITRYENNVQCEYHFDYLQRTPIRSGQITGDVGSIRWGGVKKSVRRYDLEKDDWITEETYDNWNINQMYINMLEHFLHCVTEHESTTSPIKDGWKDLQLVLAAKKSSDQGKHIQL